jgi:hypothetical protein
LSRSYDLKQRQNKRLSVAMKNIFNEYPFFINQSKNWKNGFIDNILSFIE